MGIAALDAALSGLRVSQQQINVISNNVSNVSTPGYTRKILPQSSQAIQGTTVGVLGETVIRQVDINLQRNLWTQISAVSELDIQRSYLQRIEQFHGPPDAELSIAAEVSRLHDSFAALSDSPDDPFMLASAVNQAVDTANKINDLSNLMTTSRNDAQDEMVLTVDRINDLLVQVSELNLQIASNLNMGRTTALLEDKRDDAINELSGLIEISFFKRGDGVIVIQTNEGVELASEINQELIFDPLPVSASSYYPSSVRGLYVGDPDLPQAVDLTTRNPGGKLGGLLTLRDETFVKQMAQLDEMAHKLALRFYEQGLMLFTNSSGSIPADTAPDPTTDPITPVEYVGFSATIEVNEAVIDDNTLIRSGTYGSTVPSGSNEVIRRIIEFAFGDVEYQVAENTNSILAVDLLNRGGDDLQTWLGLTSSNSVTGGRDLSGFADPASLIASANGDLDPGNDTFRLTFEEARTGLGPVDIDIELGLIADGAGNFVQDLIDHINLVVIPALPVADQTALTAMNVQFSEGANGEFMIDTQGSITVDATNPGNAMGQTGLTYLGLVDNAGNPIEPTDPYFDVQVGNNSPVRITLEPGDTDVELIAKLQAVEGLAVDTTNFALDGFLRLRPGSDFDDPDYGGDFRLIGGPFQTSGATLGSPPAATGRTALDDGVNIISALFGTYTAGTSITNESPIYDVDYGSQTNASLTPPIPTVSFRSTLLGPGADISTNVIGSQRLVDFAQKMVNEHIQELNLIDSRATDEETLQDVLQTQLLDESAVNLDEELSRLIVTQTAYSASARVVTAVDELFQELLNAVRR